MAKTSTTRPKRSVARPTRVAARPKRAAARAKGAAAKPKPLSSAAFFDLLRKRDPRTATRIDREIEERSLADVTVLAVDSSGFSRKTHAYGILQFLGVMTNVYDRIIPLLEKRGGICLSRNADNIMSLFEEPTAAIQAAIDMGRWLARYNKGKSEAWQYDVCMGINCGTVMRLTDNVYGDMVNIAFKVGEDLAAKHQILVTGAVAERVGTTFDLRYDRTVTIGAQQVALHEVRFTTG